MIEDKETGWQTSDDYESPETSEIVALTDEEADKVVRVNQSIAAREESIAQKESQQKLRVLFERAASDTLPFLIYVIYDASVALVALFYLLQKSSPALYIGTVIILFALVAPLFTLPARHKPQPVMWLKGLFS